ncbi:hypothetical protein KIN20_030194 [Parelaphostrongylus tenuis]|uniref:Uncharacterized protein n=1 Tax=Parelaphostrongylus tenuis TaxID=148309 RepID=A0AAD5R3C9_PARTN|nr:hypothetical protein KIN20_030194 [Parelaphostrongylus tenuis]
MYPVLTVSWNTVLYNYDASYVKVMNLFTSFLTNCYFLFMTHLLKQMSLYLELKLENGVCIAKCLRDVTVKIDQV